MMLNQRSDKVELLRIAEAVALEKSIDKEIILSSMETAIQKAARTKFGSENDIRAKIDRETGDISLHKVLTVVNSGEPANFLASVSTLILGIDPKLLINSGIVFPEEVFCFIVSS